MSKTKLEIYNTFIAYINYNCPASDYYINVYNDFDNGVATARDDYSVFWFMNNDGLSLKIVNQNNLLVLSKYITSADMEIELDTTDKYIASLITKLEYENDTFIDNDNQSRTVHYK